MTTPNDDNQNLEQATGADGADEADDGFANPDDDQPGDVDAGNTGDDGKGGDENKDGDAVDGKADAASDGAGKLPDAEHWKQEAKKYRDKTSVSKQESSILRKLVLKQEADGLLDRDEMAKDLGVNRKEIDAIVDRTDVPEPGEDAHVEARDRKMDEDYQNPTTQKALQRLYGDTDKQQELARAFNFALQSDPELQERYQNVDPAEAIYFVMDEGKANIDDYQEYVKTGGNAKALAAENRALKTKIAELTAPKQVTTQTKDDEDEPTAEPLQEPKTAREAKVRAFMN